MIKGNLISMSLLILRVGLGVIFFAHGMQKLFGAFGGPGIDGFSQMLKGMGFAQPVLWAWIVGSAETLGAIFLLLGVLPRTGALLIAMVMLVAIFKVHLAKGFFNAQGGIEFPLLALLTAGALFLSGAGKFSLSDKF